MTNKYKLIGGGSSSKGGSGTYKGTMPQVKFSNKQSAAKWKNQYTARGWTLVSIQATMKHPFATRNSINRSNKNAPATVYYNKDGSYVMKDRTTGKVIQISDKKDPKWNADKDIKNPYIPKK